MKKTALLSIFALSIFALQAQNFVKVNGSRFEIGGRPYYYIGTNFWYGAILGSKGPGGDRDRMIRELDFLSANGVNNLRILVGADGADGVKTKVEPALQTDPGVYNDAIFDGLDFLLAEMYKRGMYAVLYLNNSWEWSGGYGQYLQWSGAGTPPIPIVDGWPAYTKFVEGFLRNEKAITLFKDHVRHVITRTNRYTGKHYIEDPAIMSWQVCNEPRAFSAANKPAFERWLSEVTAVIRELDPNHLISSGSEGSKGSENDIELWRRIHADPNIDYVNIHAWPNNWDWINKQNIPSTTPGAIANVMEYICEHMLIARELDKPIVLEEFGMPRDNYRFTPDDPTTARDAMCRTVFEYVLYNAISRGAFAGCNSWAWGGFGRPAKNRIFWEHWDDYLGDPVQEEQGLNSIFDTDTTVSLIAAYAKKIEEAIDARMGPVDKNATQKTTALYRNLRTITKQGFMFGHQDATLYGIGWKYQPDRSDVKSVSGDYPAIYGWEIGDIELGRDVSLDSIHFTKIREHIISAYDRGGINTISWHANNPVTDGNSWDTKPVGAVESILPGGVNHKKFHTWLDTVAEFLNSLKTTDGTLVPIIFRPWHEHTGAWFWWGNSQCSPAQYNALWRETVTYLRDTKDVHNVIYAFSPSGVESMKEYLVRYPGDAWVDLLGVDVYQGSIEPDDDFLIKLQRSLRVIDQLARERMKPAALTETGNNLIPTPDWWTQTLFKAVVPYGLSYVLVWRNAYEHPEHYFGPYPGHPATDDFVRFATKKQVLMESALPDMYK